MLLFNRACTYLSCCFVGNKMIKYKSYKVYNWALDLDVKLAVNAVKPARTNR